ncbi:MAG TPA: nodulation protein NfeD [Thermoanaerobaculia bacterium]|nr:nodulation protein NfeD [Thermoanaerobaculia bacterium]
MRLRRSLRRISGSAPALLALALVALPPAPALAQGAAAPPQQRAADPPADAPSAPAAAAAPADTAAPPDDADAARPAAHPDNEVVVVAIRSIIHPVASEVVQEAIATAQARRAQALVIELATPGGLLESTREMTTAMLGAELPVVVWVAPSGAQAASAGFFLLMAADVAAMAPGTNTGAAHPVGGQGENIEGTLGEKVEQDAAATIRSLAARKGRDVELAEAAVVESRSFTAEEALESGLIDLIAPSLPRLLAEIDGRTVEKGDGESYLLATAGAAVHRVEMTPVQRLLSAIAHPNVAYILMSLGFLGLYFEFANPGAILPGVVGAICLLLAFYALSVLPLNYAGVALMLLAVLLFIAEIKVASYGLLTVGGVVSLVLGSLMLFKSPDPAIRVSLWLIGGMTASVLVTAVFLATLVVRTHGARVTTGSEGLVGKTGVARGSLAPRGKVFVHGEIWRAVAAEPVAPGQEVEVVGVEGMNLRVRPLTPPAAAGGGPANAHPASGGDLA